MVCRQALDLFFTLIVLHFRFLFNSLLLEKPHSLIIYQMVTRDTIIIIAVCGTVGLFLFVLIFVAVVKKLSAKSNPLPPIQPLAHHREQQLAKFEDSLPRSQTWYGSQTHLVPPSGFGPMGSRVSLMASNPSLMDGPESASSCSPTSYDRPPPLPIHSLEPPRPGSSSSLGSADPGGALDRPAIPRVRSLSSSARRHRPLSMSSSHSTIRTKNSRHTLRGTPHGPHSQIQIVLPAPLGSGLNSDGASRRLSRFEGEGYDRTSVVDRWMSPGTITRVYCANYA